MNLLQVMYPRCQVFASWFSERDAISLFLEISPGGGGGVGGERKEWREGVGVLMEMTDTLCDVSTLRFHRLKSFSFDC